MSTIDLSRHATDYRKHYAGVRMQQGRVLTDDDFNEHARLDAEDARRTRVDVIGPAGSPDSGFLVADPVIDAVTGRPTFTIKAGTFYLGGERLVLEADEPFHLQKDWLQQGAVAGDRPAQPVGARFDLAWLETWQQPVTAIEDKELLEVALGGPDTSARVRTLRRVRVQTGVANGDCNDSWAALLASLAGQGTLNQDFELVPDARLRVEPDGTSGTADLCSPPVAGGYLGAENQAIRVQLVDATHFTWGFDNAAPLYRVQLGVDGGALRRRITMLTVPKDQAHWPLAGQVVELLPWSAVLANGQKISERHGHLAKVTTSYNPDTRKFDIDVEPTADASGQLFGETWRERTGAGGDAGTLDDDGEYFYLRVWNRGSDTASAAAISFTAGTAVPLAHTGLKVTFSGAQLRTDDHWIIAARPDAPDIVVPWELATNRRPHGVRRWIAPLAVVSWPGGTAAGTVVNDCRETFLPLTRIRGCCTVTVGDGNESHGNFTSVQAAVESLPEKGGRVCVLPGRYDATAVRIVNRHDIVISGCGPRTRLIGAAAVDDGEAAPVISIIGGYNFGLEDFLVEAADTGLGIELIGLNPFSKEEQEATSEVINATLENLVVAARQRSALQARFVRQLFVHGCVFGNEDRACLERTVVLLGDDICFERNIVEVDGNPTDTTGLPAAFNPGTNALGGLQLEGTSNCVLVRDNLIRGGSGLGIALGSFRTVTDPDDIGPGDGGTWHGIDICDPKNDFDLSNTDDSTGATHTISTGPLEDIRIVGNFIHDLGGCGIGVARFWDLKKPNDDLITVVNLSILGNDIRRCLRRPILEPSAAFAPSIGYGGIALADAENLIVQDNTIKDCGAGPREPVCGVFVLHSECVELSRNRVQDNGATPADAPPDAAPTPKRGWRGGIVLPHAVVQIKTTAYDEKGDPVKAQLRHSKLAVKIHDNIVSAPMGQALLMKALGGVTVQANQFSTHGVLAGGVTGLLGSTVLIINLGVSNEAREFMAFKSWAKNQGTPNATSTANQKRRTLPSGHVLFSDNHVATELPEVGIDFRLASILVVTLDDLGFHDNQCAADLFDDFMVSQAFLFGLSLRATGNRFQEGIINTVFSAFSLGLLANTTALNQGTHCICALNMIPAKLVDSGNTAIVGVNPLLALLLGTKDLTCETIQKLLESMFRDDTGLIAGEPADTPPPDIP